MFVSSNKLITTMATGYKFKSVDEYLSAFPEKTAAILQQVREAIKKAAPAAQEVISYNMPAVKQNGILVYYAANKEHIGFYPTPLPIEIFKNELTAYKCSKGAIQFPLEKTMPLELIERIVQFRVMQDAENAKSKKK